MPDSPDPATSDLPDPAWPVDWLERAEWDTITLLPSASVRPGGRRLLTTNPRGGDPSTHLLRIGSYRRTSSDPGQAPALELVASTEVETTGVATAVDLPEADLHLVNDGDVTVAAARTDEQSLEMMLVSAAGLPDAASRATVIGITWDMLSKGELSAGDFLDSILTLLTWEQTAELIEPLFSLALNAAEYWSPTGLVPRRLAKVAEVAWRRSADPEHRGAALWALAACASHAEHFALVDDGAAEDADLAWRVMARRASLGRFDAQAVATLSERDPYPDSTWRALAVSAARPSSESKDEVWTRIFESEQLPGSAELTEVARSFWRPVQHSLLIPWAERYLEQIQDLHADGSEIAQSTREIVRAMTPATCADDWPDRAQALGAADDLDTDIRRTLHSGADLLTRVLRART